MTPRLAASAVRIIIHSGMRTPASLSGALLRTQEGKELPVGLLRRCRLVVDRLDRVLAQVRPTLASGTSAAPYAWLELLVALVLLRGSRTHRADIEQFEQELSHHGFPEHVSENVLGHVFARTFNVVVHLGPVSHPDSSLFLPVLAEERAIVGNLRRWLVGYAHWCIANEVSGMSQLLSLGSSDWNVDREPTSRGRGRPSVSNDHYRNALFESDLGARTLPDMARLLFSTLPTRPNNADGPRKELERLDAIRNGRRSPNTRARAERPGVPVPAGWAESLFRERLAPFAGDLTALHAEFVRRKDHRVPVGDTERVSMKGYTPGPQK